MNPYQAKNLGPQTWLRGKPRDFYFLFMVFFVLISVCPAFSSNLRLLAMGEMQGIVEDESDYELNPAEIASKQNRSLEIDYFSNSYGNYFPRNNYPSDLIYDLERKGGEDNYKVRAVYGIGPKYRLGIIYDKNQEDFRSAYVNYAGHTHTLRKIGNSEIMQVILGYPFADWANVAIAYNGSSVRNDFSGTEATREGVQAKENSAYSGLACGIKLYNPWFWFDLAVGETKDVALTSQTLSQVYTYHKNSPGMISYLLGAKLLENKVRVNCGGYSRSMGYETQSHSFLGVEMHPQNSLILGIGSDYDLKTAGYFDFCSIATKVGAEYLLPQIKNLKLRAGIISRAFNLGRSYFEDAYVYCQDYTCGLGYEWGRFKLDFAYKNYEDVTGLGENWLTTSTPLSPIYIFTYGSERNAQYAISVKYEI